MKEEQNSLTCDEILHRLTTRQDLIFEGKAISLAFLRRQSKDGTIEEGLSVDIKSIRPLTDSLNPEISLKGVRLVSSLHTGRVKDLNENISVEKRPTDMNPGHAEILGLPHPKKETAQAEFIAGELAKQARSVWSKA